MIKSVTEFRGKAPASATKVRGGYYTPPAIASFLAQWVAEAGARLLEPSCGDGNILRVLSTQSAHVQGVELLPDEAERARQFGAVVTANFFSWFSDQQFGAWDGVAGNPPYIRFGNWADAERAPALALMQGQNLRPSKLTNAWVPFVVASVMAVREGGRIGLVLPAELLQVTYAEQLRDYLLRELSELTLVTFERLVFDGILQEVVLLLGIRGSGPSHVRTMHLGSADELAGCKISGPSAPALLHDREKWTKYFLPSDQILTLRDVRATGGLFSVDSYASVDVGIVTGRNSFFTLTDREARDLKLKERCRPLVSRSAQLAGLLYREADFRTDVEHGHRTWILDLQPADETRAPVARYLARGEAENIHEGYKCSIRTPWWKTPSMWIPDAFMLRQIHHAPRIMTNEAGATSTDTVHRMRIKSGIDPQALACVFNNSATFAFTEVMGRSYGGGVLELEPREAEHLPIPDPSLASPDLIDDVDVLLRSGELTKALDLVDREVLVVGAGWDPTQVEACRCAWQALRRRRTSRGRSKA